MMDIVARLVAAFLAHQLYGINAMAASLPRLQITTAGVSIATDDAPPTVNIYTDSDDAGVAARLTPPESPAIIVWGDSSSDSDVKNVKTSKDVAIGIAYVTNDLADDLTHIRASGYLLRGAKRSLRRLRSQADSDGFRELNGVRILDITRVDEQRIVAAGEGGSPVFWGVLAVHMTVVDGVI